MAEPSRGVAPRIHPATAERAMGTVRPGPPSTLAAPSPPEVERRVLTGSDGRKVESDVL